MKVLKDILYKVRLKEVIGSTNIAVEHVASDSRKVLPFSLFIAVKGIQSDGHAFIDQALSTGAIAIVCEEIPELRKEGVTYIQVPNSAEALGMIASNFYDNPSQQLKLIGVTGTNGKTTTTTLLYRLFLRLGRKTGLISTVENYIHKKVSPSTHTTPDPISLNALLKDMVDEGCAYCFMEVSSHAVDQKRIAGLHFAGGVFTNITHDHLDYHKTFNAYVIAKKAFFDGLPASAFAITNVDDRQGEIMVSSTKAKVKTLALKTMADYKARVLENTFGGLHLNIDNNEIYTRIIGGFNAYNLLSVYAVAIELEQEPIDVLTHMSALNSVDGRFEYVKSGNEITAVVDYAHTPDALENVLKTIKEIRTGNEQVITVVGCGGDRDRQKRPIMAQIASTFSDKVVLTSDNPRTEDPEAILKDMKGGLDPVLMSKCISLADRREAIKLACTLANQGDIILIAGKGHENYQEINGERHPFDDMEVVTETFKMLQK